jgi:uroporphyrinogen decarboxylase
MTSRERIYRAIQGKSVDRIPFSLWRHFPLKDKTAEGLARATINFQKKFGFDLLKVTPASGYFLEAFGARLVYRKDKEGRQKGTREVIESPIKNSKDWLRLRVLDVKKDILGRELKAIKLISKEIRKETPIVQTIPNPLTIVRGLAGDDWIEHLREKPGDLEVGLSIISETVIKFAKANLESGADGIFFFTQVASYDFLTEKEYRSFGSKYDLEILKELKSKTDLLILHIHGLNIMFNILKDYPVQIINWHDRKTKPSLKEAQEKFKGAVLGGIEEWTLAEEKVEKVKTQVKDAISQTNGRRLIIGPGCVIPTNTLEKNIKAIKEIIEDQVFL